MLVHGSSKYFIFNFFSQFPVYWVYWSLSTLIPFSLPPYPFLLSIINEYKDSGYAIPKGIATHRLRMSALNHLPTYVVDNPNEFIGLFKKKGVFSSNITLNNHELSRQTQSSLILLIMWTFWIVWAALDSVLNIPRWTGIQQLWLSQVPDGDKKNPAKSKLKVLVLSLPWQNSTQTPTIPQETCVERFYTLLLYI